MQWWIVRVDNKLYYSRFYSHVGTETISITMDTLRRVERQGDSSKNTKCTLLYIVEYKLIKCSRDLQLIRNQFPPQTLNSKFTTLANSELNWIDNTLFIFYCHGRSFVANPKWRYWLTGVERASPALLLLLCFYPSLSRFFLNDEWDCFFEFLFKALLTRWLQVKERKHL